jgi:hypothetical protein
VKQARFQAPAAEPAAPEEQMEASPTQIAEDQAAQAETIWQESESIGEPPVGDEFCAEGFHGCTGGLLDNLSFFGGVQASKNNSNRGQDGSFGFQEGLNFGTPAGTPILPSALGLQLGFQANQANLEGAAFTVNDRKQYFVTGGLFHRSNHGVQGGLVLDYLWDKWNYNLNVGQLRGELSFAFSDRNSLGFWFSSSVKDDRVVATVFGQDVDESWETVDYYTLFYRTGFFAGGRGEAHLMAGLTEDSDGIIGGKSRLPLINGWALENEFTYLVPDEPRGGGGNEHESWNLGINLVWYPGSLDCGSCSGMHRPLFDVANNGSLILRRKP